jgi:hypothetical protein
MRGRNLIGETADGLAVKQTTKVRRKAEQVAEQVDKKSLI